MNTTVGGHQVNGGATKRGAPDPTLVLPEGVKAAGSRADALIEQARQAKIANEAAGGNELVKPLVPASRPNPGVITGDFDPRNPRPPEFDPASNRDRASRHRPRHGSSPLRPTRHRLARPRLPNRQLPKTKATGSINSSLLRDVMTVRRRIPVAYNRRYKINKGCWRKLAPRPLRLRARGVGYVST